MRKELSVGEWLLTLLLMSIPVVNIIMLIVWAVSESDARRRNFSRAYLIWYAISLVVGIIIGFLCSTFILSLFASIAASV